MATKVETVLIDMSPISAAILALSQSTAARTCTWLIVLDIFRLPDRLGIKLREHFSPIAGCHDGLFFLAVFSLILC